MLPPRQNGIVGGWCFGEARHKAGQAVQYWSRENMLPLARRRPAATPDPKGREKGACRCFPAATPGRRPATIPDFLEGRSKIAC